MRQRLISRWPRVRRVWVFLVSAIMLVLPVSAAAAQGSELRPGVGALVGTLVRAERWERVELPRRDVPPTVATTSLP